MSLGNACYQLSVMTPVHTKSSRYSLFWMFQVACIRLFSSLTVINTAARTDTGSSLGNWHDAPLVAVTCVISHVWKSLIGNARWTNPLDGDENTGFRSTEFPIHQHAGLEVPRLNLLIIQVWNIAQMNQDINKEEWFMLVMNAHSMCPVIKH